MVREGDLGNFKQFLIAEVIYFAKIKFELHVRDVDGGNSGQELMRHVTFDRHRTMADVPDYRGNNRVDRLDLVLGLLRCFLIISFSCGV